MVADVLFRPKIREIAGYSYLKNDLTLYLLVSSAENFANSLDQDQQMIKENEKVPRMQRVNTYAILSLDIRSEI